jgi:hypothetical protein
MRRTAFTVITALPPGDAISRLVELLEAGGVEVAREESVLRSVRTPVPLLNVEPRLYSNRNWLGINPFVLVTSVEMRAAASANGTVVNVSIDRWRVILIWALAAFLVLFSAFSAPFWATVSIAGIMLVLCALHLRWAHTLTRFEIEQQLRS